MLNRQYTKSQLVDLKYVAMEIKMKDDTIENSISGLFLGYKSLTLDSNEKSTKTDNPFVWMYSKKCVYLYSLKYYEIQSIQVSLGANGKTTQFDNVSNKQPEAIKGMLEIIEALRKQGKIQDNGLVDIYKYEALPSALKEHLECSEKKDAPINNTTTNNSTNISSYMNRNNQRRTPLTTYKPKEIETFFIERTTRYSVEEALEKMKKKIIKVKNGTYKPPKLKKTLEEKENSTTKTNEKNGNDDEDHTADNENYYGYGNGMYGVL